MSVSHAIFTNSWTNFVAGMPHNLTWTVGDGDQVFLKVANATWEGGIGNVILWPSIQTSWLWVAPSNPGPGAYTFTITQGSGSDVSPEFYITVPGAPQVTTTSSTTTTASTTPSSTPTIAASNASIMWNATWTSATPSATASGYEMTTTTTECECTKSAAPLPTGNAAAGNLTVMNGTAGYYTPGALPSPSLAYSGDGSGRIRAGWISLLVVMATGVMVTTVSSGL